MSIDVYYQQLSDCNCISESAHPVSPTCLPLPYLMPDDPTATLLVLDLIDDLSLPPDALLQAHHKDLLVAIPFVNALEHLPELECMRVIQGGVHLIQYENGRLVMRG